MRTNRATSLILAVGLLAACSSSEASSPQQPTSCDRSQRGGTYMLTMREQSGNCGPIDSTLVSLSSDPDAGIDGCDLHSDIWTDGDCKNERTFTCATRVADNSAWGGYSIVTNDSVAVTKQTTADGSRIEGTISMSLSDGSQSCHSTYDVTYVRQ